MKEGKNRYLLFVIVIIGIAMISYGTFSWLDSKPKEDNPANEKKDNNELEPKEPKKEDVQNNLVGKYVNNQYEGDYFILNADGTAEATIVFSGDHDEGAKSYFTKDELTYTFYYSDDAVMVELVPDESLDEVYKQWFGKEGSYYYHGKLINGVYEFESINGSAVATPGSNKYVKK